MVAGDDDEPLTDIDVVVDASAATDPSITAVTSITKITGITKPGEPTPAMLEATLPADEEPSTLDASVSGRRLLAAAAATLPADEEPSTLEPSVGVRGLAGAAAAVAGAAPAETTTKTSTTLNVESRLRKALDPPGASPRKPMPATSTAPRPKISKSRTIQGLGSMSAEPILTPSEPFRITGSPAISLPSSATSKARAPMATEPMFDISGSVTNEIAAKEDQDEDTALDAGHLSGGESVAAVAAAASSEKEEDDDVPTSIRHEQAVILASSDLSTDPGSAPNHEPKHAMEMMPTQPAPFPISSHLVAAAAEPLPPAAAEPLPPATPPESKPRPVNRQGPTLMVRRPKRRTWPFITVLAAVTALGVLAFVERQTIMSAIGARAAPATLASESSAGAAATLTPPEAASGEEPSEPVAGGTASAPASSASDLGKPRIAPVRKPPPPPPWRPGTGKPPSSPAPRGSTPLHI